MRFKGFTIKAITYSAVCVALSVILSYVKLFEMPQGGSVTAFSMLFITLVGYMFGTKVGVCAGVAHGLITLAMGGYVVHPLQLLLDYPLAFGALGLSGLLRGKRFGLYSGYLLGVTGRLIFCVTSGVFFFAEYVPPGDIPVVYSFIYNSSYMLPEVVVTLIILSVPQVRTLINKLAYDALRSA